jgi:hypothetical protein
LIAISRKRLANLPHLGRSAIDWFRLATLRPWPVAWRLLWRAAEFAKQTQSVGLPEYLPTSAPIGCIGHLAFCVSIVSLTAHPYLSIRGIMNPFRAAWFRYVIALTEHSAVGYHKFATVGINSAATEMLTVLTGRKSS